MANTLCLFLPFPLVVSPILDLDEDWSLLRVLLFCRRFSKVKAPDEIMLELHRVRGSVEVRDLASLPNLKSLNFFYCIMDDFVWVAHELFEILPDCTSLTSLWLPDIPGMTDWGILAEALTTSKSLETVGCVLFGERGEGSARALDAGLCADTPLSSVNLTICGLMSETGLQALENLLSNKSLCSVYVIVKGDMSYSLAVTLSRALAGQTAVKSLELRVNGKLSFSCANLIEQGIVKNNSLSNLVLCLHGEVPDNWQAIVENLNAQLAEKSTVTFKILPNTFRHVTADDFSYFLPNCLETYGLFQQRSITLDVWGELTVDVAKPLFNDWLYNGQCTWLCHLTLNIHGKLTDEFLYCTATYADNQKPLCPITINTWAQLTNEGKALFKELELDKNPAVILNVCDVQVPSDESGDDKIVSIDDPKSLIKLLEEAENTGKENLTATINVQSDDSDDSSRDDSDDSTCDDSDDSTGRSWNDSLLFGLARYRPLTSLTLTLINFSPRSTKLSFFLISCLENFISLKSLNLTLNEYNYWKDTYPSFLRKGLVRNTSLISLTLTLNIYTRPFDNDGFYDISEDDFYDISDDDVVPSISMDSFTLTINDFCITGYRSRVDIINYVWGLKSGGLWPNYRSLDTFNLTLNNQDEVRVSSLLEFFDAVMKVNSLRTLRLKLNRSLFPRNDFSKWVVKSPSLELIELTIFGTRNKEWWWRRVGWLETLKWEKQ
ncbi:PREDICTED: uncharacterized protein LOC107355665 [Acropora digitifera]|uniref:uncharacterized protein LOC107355665 n=1 Tax=Acropora digitifera TaxID=70779 RepID=UPI00077ABE92|nr:PREDICTED: uncharacterized protein LOC107355665 [Acropora digitifera]